jgi:nucleotidyltransferase/DNA polymerase involved in DNA repair
VRALPGVGYKTAQQLAELGVATVKEARRVSLARLTARLGDTLGVWAAGVASLFLPGAW